MTYTPLTQPQIEQIRSCIQYGIDLTAVRDKVRATWPAAIAIQIRTNVEYDDGSRYYWAIAEIAILDKDGEIKTATPGAALSYEDALDELRHFICLGGAADPEDDCSDSILLHLDTPTLNQLYQANP